jgi:hypothetical protein
MGVSGQRHSPAALTPGERTHGTHCTGAWVGPRAGVDTEATGKPLSPLPGSNLDHPVVTLYTTLRKVRWIGYVYNSIQIRIL